MLHGYCVLHSAINTQTGEWATAHDQNIALATAHAATTVSNVAPHVGGVTWRKPKRVQHTHHDAKRAFDNDAATVACAGKAERELNQPPREAAATANRRR